MIEGVPSQNNYFEYRIKPGDTLSLIIFRMFGYTQQHTLYKRTSEYLLVLNPHIKSPHHIKASEMLRLGVIPTTAPLVKNIALPANSSKLSPYPAHFISNQIANNHYDDFWLLSWLEHNSNWLTIPGGVAASTATNLLSQGNIALINQVNDYYADYRSGKISKGQYDYLRKTSLDRLRTNIGPFEKWLFGNKTTHQSIRIARAGGIPANAHIAKHASRLNTLATVGKVGGYALVGVGLTASCMQIANTPDRNEKNEIFVETIASTGAGLGASVVIGLFLISNPIGWGAAIVLATGTAALSYGAGKYARYTYDRRGNQIDLVAGVGVDSICH